MSIGKGLQRAGMESIHFDGGHLAVRMQKRLDNGEDPVMDYPGVQVFTDMENAMDGGCPGNLIFIYKRFKEIYQWYPQALYILNTRRMEDWIQSLHHHRSGFTETHRKYYGLDTVEQVFDLWRREWKKHHKAVRKFFKGKDNFLEWNIDKDSFKPLADFCGVDEKHFRVEHRSNWRSKVK